MAPASNSTIAEAFGLFGISGSLTKRAAPEKCSLGAFCHECCVAGVMICSAKTGACANDNAIVAENSEVLFIMMARFLFQAAFQYTIKNDFS